MMAKSCEWRISRTYLLEKYSHLQIVNSTYKIDLLPCRMFSPVKIFTATHRGGHQLRKRALRHLLSLVISLTSLALSVNDSTQPGSWLGCMSKSLIKHVKRNASPKNTLSSNETRVTHVFWFTRLFLELLKTTTRFNPTMVVARNVSNIELELIKLTFSLQTL